MEIKKYFTTENGNDFMVVVEVFNTGLSFVNFTNTEVVTTIYLIDIEAKSNLLAKYEATVKEIESYYNSSLVDYVSSLITGLESDVLPVVNNFIDWDGNIE